MVTADFNNDGRLDIAVANPLNNTVTILLGNGDGTFTTGQTLSVGIDPSGLAVGDFNGDGRLDLAVADAGSDNVMVFLGLGDGTFGSPRPWPSARLRPRSSRATSSTTASPTSPWPTSFRIACPC